MVEVGEDSSRRTEGTTAKSFTMDEAFLNDLLECSVCLEQLDSSSKVLPCQHTFCKRCLHEIVNSHKELRCPECRILVDVKIEELPCNILLVRLLEGIKNNVRPKRALSCVLEHTTAVPPPPPSLPRVGGGPAESSSSTRQTPPHPQLPQVPLSGEVRTVPKQVLQPCPCAKALYPYEAKVPGDLTFRKGDIIILRKRVDQNWFYGELGEKAGFVPASFVQVVVPVMSHVPQCKALYDFQISNSEEKDCLTFSKGDILTVIRRIDDHWAEGKLRERIGIFPISFVEMNASARAIMKLSANLQPGVSSTILPPPAPSESRFVPILPATIASSSGNTSSLCQETSPTISSPLVVSAAVGPPFMSSAFTSPIHSGSGPHHHHLHHHPISSSVPQQSDGFGMSTSMDGQSVFSMGQQRQPLPLFQPLPQTGRSDINDESQGHNEVGSDISNCGYRSRSTPSPGPFCTTVAAVTPPLVSQRAESMPCPRTSPQQNTDPSHPPTYLSSTDGTIVSHTPSRSGSISHPPTHVPVPSFYLALYSYRPQKEDELELRKGELYTLGEKCQDGWFKGTSLRTGQSGVFPGNYVQLAKSAVLQTHMMTSPASHVSSSTSPPAVNSCVSNCQSRAPVTSDGGNHASLPITNSSGSMPISGGRLAPAASSPSPVSLNHPAVSEWAHSVSVLGTPVQRLSRSINVNAISSPGIYKSEMPSKNISCGQSRSPGVSPWAADFGQVPSASPLGSEFPTRTTSASPTRMLSYQPSSVSGNSSLVAGNQGVHHEGHAQTRFCVSQPSTPLMMPHAATSAVSNTNPFVSNVGMMSNGPTSAIPPGCTSASVSQTRLDKVPHKEKKEKEIVSLMKRLTKRKSKSPPPSDFSCDNPSFVDASSSSGQAISTVHVRSTSCPSEALGSQGVSHKKTGSFDSGNNEVPRSSSRPKQPAPLVRERFRCIVPYPPNSDYELELKVGDIVYVHKKREDGWYKGTLQRTGKTGLFPSSFVEGF